MKLFEINTNGKSSIKDKTKDFYQMLVGGVIAYLILLSAFRYTIDNKGFFLFLAIFLTVLYIFVFIIVPITLKVRINKVIRKIEYSNNQILLITNKEYQYSSGDLNFEEVKSRFTGFSIRNKDGILVKTKTGKEYWIIEDFYNDFAELKVALLVHE